MKHQGAFGPVRIGLEITLRGSAFSDTEESGGVSMAKGAADDGEDSGEEDDEDPAQREATRLRPEEQARKTLPKLTNSPSLVTLLGLVG